MPRLTRRFTLARLALIAWLVFVVVASVVPFLVFADLTIIGNRSSWDTIDLTIEGGAIDVRSGQWRSVLSGWYAPTVTWSPSASEWFEFNYEQQPFWMFTFSPWPILLAPTLLALTTSYVLRHRKHRRLTNLGRTPCPTCGYDATDLTTCPECGATIDPQTETQT